MKQWAYPVLNSGYARDIEEHLDRLSDERVARLDMSNLQRIQMSRCSLSIVGNIIGREDCEVYNTSGRQWSFAGGVAWNKAWRGSF